MRTSEAAARDNSVYEGGALREVTGCTIRPGGLGLTERAVDFCRFRPGAAVLDVGCGAGATVEHLRSRYGLEASGVDASPVLVEEGLRRNPALPLSVGWAEKVDLPAAALDGVVCECVLSLVRDPLAALAEFGRVLRPGGYLIASDVYHRRDAQGGARDRLLPSPGPSARREILAGLAACGFSLLLWEDHTPLLKEMAARLMLAHGSLEGLCSFGSAVRPGYYLLVAGKTTLGG